MIHFDQGGEFKNPALQAFCTKRGIMTHLTAAFTPMQNGTVERANKTIGDTVRAMLRRGGMQQSIGLRQRAVLYKPGMQRHGTIFMGSLHGNVLLVNLLPLCLTTFSV